MKYGWAEEGPQIISLSMLGLGVTGLFGLGAFIGGGLDFEAWLGSHPTSDLGHGLVMDSGASK